MRVPYPNGERAWVTLLDENQKPKYLITSKPNREMYFIYEVQNEKLARLGKDKNPLTLEAKYVK